MVILEIINNINNPNKTYFLMKKFQKNNNKY